MIQTMVRGVQDRVINRALDPTSAFQVLKILALWDLPWLSPDSQRTKVFRLPLFFKSPSSAPCPRDLLAMVSGVSM